MIISQIISLSDCVVVSPRCLCLRDAPSGLRASTGVQTRRWRPFQLFRRLVSLLKVAGVTLRGSVTDQSGGSRISQAGRCFRSWPAHIALVEVRVWLCSDHTHTHSLVRAQHNGFCVWRMLTQVFQNLKIKVMTSNWWYFLYVSDVAE